ALDAGNGDAGVELSYSYGFDKDSVKMLDSLRAGARLGSQQCLIKLENMYLGGNYGQQKDKAHGACYKTLRDELDLFEQPQTIPDFDERCPQLPVLPYNLP
ncbi:MAG: hypothetical protein LBJ64_00035, partial [Deltaproteobacteria bacterium]|nr:hypothetical protein [Deltaproteobacteria bacterium]